MKFSDLRKFQFQFIVHQYNSTIEEKTISMNTSLLDLYHVEYYCNVISANHAIFCICTWGKKSEVLAV